MLRFRTHDSVPRTPSYLHKYHSCDTYTLYSVNCVLRPTHMHLSCQRQLKTVLPNVCIWSARAAGCGEALLGGGACRRLWRLRLWRLRPKRARPTTTSMLYVTARSARPFTCIATTIRCMGGCSRASSPGAGLRSAGLAAAPQPPGPLPPCALCGTRPRSWIGRGAPPRPP